MAGNTNSITWNFEDIFNSLTLYPGMGELKLANYLHNDGLLILAFLLYYWLIRCTCNFQENKILNMLIRHSIVITFSYKLFMKLFCDNPHEVIDNNFDI